MIADMFYRDMAMIPSLDEEHGGRSVRYAVVDIGLIGTIKKTPVDDVDL